MATFTRTIPQTLTANLPGFHPFRYPSGGYLDDIVLRLDVGAANDNDVLRIFFTMPDDEIWVLNEVGFTVDDATNDAHDSHRIRVFIPWARSLESSPAWQRSASAGEEHVIWRFDTSMKVESVGLHAQNATAGVLYQWGRVLPSSARITLEALINDAGGAGWAAGSYLQWHLFVSRHPFDSRSQDLILPFMAGGSPHANLAG